MDAHTLNTKEDLVCVALHRQLPFAPSALWKKSIGALGDLIGPVSDAELELVRQRGRLRVEYDLLYPGCTIEQLKEHLTALRRKGISVLSRGGLIDELLAPDDNACSCASCAAQVAAGWLPDDRKVSGAAWCGTCRQSIAQTRAKAHVVSSKHTAAAETLKLDKKLVELEKLRVLMVPLLPKKGASATAGSPTDVLLEDEQEAPVKPDVGARTVPSDRPFEIPSKLKERLSALIAAEMKSLEQRLVAAVLEELQAPIPKDST